MSAKAITEQARGKRAVIRPVLSGFSAGTGWSECETVYLSRGCISHPAKTEFRVKQHLKHAMQRVDTADSGIAGKRHDLHSA